MPLDRNANIDVEEVVMTVARRYPDGHVVITRLPFNEMPNWLKDKVNPIWAHPSGCECIECWNAYEHGHIVGV